jgi:hypothetical protein
MEAASVSETPVNFCQNTRRNNPEDSHLYRPTGYIEYDGRKIVNDELGCVR